jgi:hypothetical protein
VKPGAVVIDVGINDIPDATKKRGYRMVGDVDFDNVKMVASAITPVSAPLPLPLVVPVVWWVPGGALSTVLVPCRTWCARTGPGRCGANDHSDADEEHCGEWTCHGGHGVVGVHSLSIAHTFEVRAIPKRAFLLS